MQTASLIIPRQYANGLYMNEDNFWFIFTFDKEGSGLPVIEKLCIFKRAHLARHGSRPPFPLAVCQAKSKSRKVAKPVCYFTEESNELH